jgi:predicted  nucleic acid-binding Zn-ribbon protein
MWGYPARQIKKQRRIWALQGKLPDMRQRIRKLEQEVEDLRARLEGTTEGESEN